LQDVPVYDIAACCCTISNMQGISLPSKTGKHGYRRIFIKEAWRLAGIRHIASAYSRNVGEVPTSVRSRYCDRVPESGKRSASLREVSWNSLGVPTCHPIRMASADRHWWWALDCQELVSNALLGGRFVESHDLFTRVILDDEGGTVVPGGFEVAV
jgi:hypothetical protein